ncbi:MAG: SRPBCC family protein [Actinomycetota bacterium]
MSRSIESTITIAAAPAHVWAILTNFAAYPTWNEFITNITGPLHSGARLNVRIKPPQSRGMTFTPTIKIVDEARHLSWLGRFVVPGLFDGTHEFLLTPKGPDQTQFTQRETFRGVLVPALSRTLRHTSEGFALFNQALKKRAESTAKPSTLNHA